MMNTVSVHNRFAKKPVRKGRIGITRGQALIFLLAFTLFFYLLTELVFASESHQEPASKLITVQAGDSLWKLAKRHQDAAGMNVQELVDAIMELNRLDSVMIYPGQNIKIPLK
ncbi:cell division suppressor protein YneA [Brevibacillus sp. H7]|jgi:nucleoid-associated protein YgaU|uniref:cell division suppressor protein YneA n=1 Tax=Brevibacillus sp. H7 TaxID=3349138 RepID=UPI00380748BE